MTPVAGVRGASGACRRAWQESTNAKESTISRTDASSRALTPEDFDELARGHLDGIASREEVQLLERHRDGWISALHRVRDDLDRELDEARTISSEAERELVVADLRAERDRVSEVLDDITPTDPPELQLSWSDGAVVAWSSGADAPAEGLARLRERLEEVGAPGAPWQEHHPVVLPDHRKADAVSAAVAETLGWLVSLGAPRTGEDDGADVGTSARWVGLCAALAVRLVAQGRMLPQLERLDDGDRDGGRASFGVRWKPALVEDRELRSLHRAMPGAVAAVSVDADARTITEQLLTACVDAICRDAAGRVEVPAPSPDPRSAVEVAEVVLGRLDGSAFEAPLQHGTEISRGLRTWAKAALGRSQLRLTVRLDPPDDDRAWHLKTLAPMGKGKLERVEPAMSKASHGRREAIKSELDRLEALYEPLMHDRSKHRGEVILSQDEAWRLMTEVGQQLQAAGFDVEVPPLSRKKPTPSLRVTSTGEGERSAHSLTDVRWSAVFDDVELTAKDIMRLAEESRPLVKTRGRWVEVDKADLEAARAALEEREDDTRLSGAEMLRYALGLEGGPLTGGISVAGRSWAADLLRSAQEIPEHPPTQPPGFVGELRNYQADALAWLDFLDGAGLGGCLALDMGLGKTPVMLAHIQQTLERGPALVIAPPAVVGNWASESAKFTPGLDVVVHHGANRADHDEVDAEVDDADVVITTYATAVRDIAALEEIRWGKVVLDEAQVIKNPATETAQQLRRLEAHTKTVLTGTPIENGLSDLWSLMDFVNPGLLGDRATFVSQMSRAGGGASDSAEQVLRTLNGVLVFRRTKAEPAIAEELPDRIDELDHCPMTSEQIGLYQAVLDDLSVNGSGEGSDKKGAVLAAITALKQICNHPAAYTGDEKPLRGRSGKLARLEEIVENVFEAGERMLIFTHFATWGERLAEYLTERTGIDIDCYHGGLSRGARDRMVTAFQEGEGPGALVLSLKAGGTGLNLTAASHVVLYDRWWNPAVEDQARDRAWRIGQEKTVVAHRLVCPGTIDERVEEVVQGKRRIADMVLPKSSTVGDLDSNQLQQALGIDPDTVLTHDLDGEPDEATARIA